LRFLLTAFILFPFLLLSQSVTKTNANQANGWYNYFGNHKIAKHFAVHTEIQWRRNNVITDKQQLLMRYGVDYLLNENIVFTLGYGFIQTYPYGEMPVKYEFNEHRLWQTLTIRNKVNRFYLNHRFRPEQRWLEEKKLNAKNEFDRNGWKYFNRIRYRFMVTVPLNKEALDKGSIFATAYEEAFINFGKNVALNIFDQNRIYAAIGYQFVKNGNIQLGHLNQFLIKPDAVRFENNHTLMLSLTYNVDFTKLKKEMKSILQ
jgi:hypothetical protein